MEASTTGLPAEIREFADAYHAHDPEAMGTFYAPDATFTFPGIELHGRDQIIELWTGWFTAFPDIRSEFLPSPSEGRTTALHWVESGTHLGKLDVAGFKLAPTGKQLRWRGVSIYVSGDEGFESVTYCVDRLTLALQLAGVRSLPGLLRGGVDLWRESR